MPAERDREREAALRADIVARLAPVCAGWPREQFAALVTAATRFRLRWADATSTGPGFTARASARAHVSAATPLAVERRLVTGLAATVVLGALMWLALT